MLQWQKVLLETMLPFKAINSTNLLQASVKHQNEVLFYRNTKNLIARLYFFNHKYFIELIDASINLINQHMS